MWRSGPFGQRLQDKESSHKGISQVGFLCICITKICEQVVGYFKQQFCINIVFDLNYG